MDQPLISVVVPMYNAAATVGATLSGIFTQTYPRVEIVAVDDGSQDGSGDLAAAYGDRLRVITQPRNRGLPAARNTGVRHARGDFIVWNDADDIMMPTCLERMMAIYQAAGAGRRIVTTDCAVMTPKGLTGRRVLPRVHPPRHAQRLALLQENFVCYLSLYPRALTADIGELDETMTHLEDRDYWLRAVFAGWEIVRQPEALALYRWTGTSASTAKDKMNAGEDYTLRKVFDHDQRYGLTPTERDYLRRRLASQSPRYYVTEGDLALRRGDFATAAKLLPRAADLRPHDKRLRLRAVAAQTPVTARLLARRLAAEDRRIGWQPSMDR